MKVLRTSAFAAVAVAITWVFADDIIDAVEDRHYPRHAAFGKHRDHHLVADAFAVDEHAVAVEDDKVELAHAHMRSAKGELKVAL